jgi:hypothetical protein
MPLRRLLLDFVESQRLAYALVEGAMADDCQPDQCLRGKMATMALYGQLLQELIGDVLPTIPDGVFAAVRSFPGLWPKTHPNAEGAALAARLAYRSLEKAIIEAEKIDLDEVMEDLLYGALEAANTEGLLAESLPGLDEDEVLDIIFAGGPLPERYSQTYVNAAYTHWQTKGIYVGHFGELEECAE